MATRTSRNRGVAAAAAATDDGLLIWCASGGPRVANPHNPISELVDDLLAGILIRLPNARSAARCESVCKQWRSLISSTNFRRRFVSHHRNKGDDDDNSEPLLLSKYKPQSILSFLPVPDEIRKYFIVFDSFKDLVLCGFRMVEKGESYPEAGRLFFVCNPVTKQWVALPLAPERSEHFFHETTKSLVCEPRNNSNMDVGDDGAQVLIDSDYHRFRVVRVSGSSEAPMVDLFCSESGKWMTDAIHIDRRSGDLGNGMPWCNGKLYWPSCELNYLAVWNPFCPDIPPARIDSIQVPVGASDGDLPEVWVSQGALHTTRVLDDPRPGHSGDLLCVWRWREEDVGGKWTLLYVVPLELLLISVKKEYGHLGMCDVIAVHPSKPEIVFLEMDSPHDYPQRLIFSCDSWSMELKLFARGMPGFGWKVLQPRFICWPTPIPSYEKLRERRMPSG